MGLLLEICVVINDILSPCFSSVCPNLKLYFNLMLAELSWKQHKYYTTATYVPVA